jgi:uncharacterized protein YndB with AHSA1/START domain
MAASDVTSDTTLRLERRLAAAPAKVFEAWTTADALKRWFAPSPEFTVHVHELEARAGGRYRIEMRDPQGVPYVVAGVYETFSPPSRLAFSWEYVEQSPENRNHGRTRVTMELHPEAPGTRLVLVHERFLSLESRDDHGKGWIGCLDQLERTFER